MSDNFLESTLWRYEFYLSPAMIQADVKTFVCDEVYKVLTKVLFVYGNLVRDGSEEVHCIFYPKMTALNHD